MWRQHGRASGPRRCVEAAVILKSSSNARCIFRCLYEACRQNNFQLFCLASVVIMVSILFCDPPPYKHAPLQSAAATMHQALQQGRRGVPDGSKQKRSSAQAL